MRNVYELFFSILCEDSLPWEGILMPSHTFPELKSLEKTPVCKPDFFLSFIITPKLTKRRNCNTWRISKIDPIVLPNQIFLFCSWEHLKGFCQSGLSPSGRYKFSFKVFKRRLSSIWPPCSPAGRTGTLRCQVLGLLSWKMYFILWVPSWLGWSHL